MPIYTFYNTRTKKTFDEMMSISEMEEYLTKNKHIRHAQNGVPSINGTSQKDRYRIPEDLIFSLFLE